MSFHPAFKGRPIDPDGFPVTYEARPKPTRPENKLLRDFSPSARRSAEDILRNLKHTRGRDRDMFFNDCFLTPEAMFTKADEGAEDPTMRGRHPHHPHFRVPTWLDDQDMKDLTARMSHAPHFATLGRRGGGGGPWRERRHSGGSAMSATSEDDTIDHSGDRMSQGSSGSEQPTVPHEIPIMFEAPPPPSQMPQPPAGPPQQPPQQQDAEEKNRPTRTTSAVDAREQGSTGTIRNSRCASAPPEMAEQQGLQQQQPQDPQQQPQRFVSKINITPQAPTVPQPSSSPQYSPLPAKFNTVPRPFVSPDPQQQQQQYPPQFQQQYQQQPQQYSTPPPQQPPLGFFPPHPEQQWQFSGQQYPQQQQYQQQQQQYPQQQPQQQQYQQQEPQRGGQRPSVVRNIPIFVEGRDDPIDQENRASPAPAPAPQWTQTRPQPQQQPQQFHQQPQPQQFHQQPQPQQFHQQPQPQQFHQQPQPQQFHQQPQPQPRPPQPQQPQPPQPTPRQKRQQVHQNTPPPQQPIPHPVPMPMPGPHGIPPCQPQEPHAQEAPVPEPPAVPKDPRMAQIERVSETVKELAGKVDVFTGGKKDREFLYLDEMLTRALLQLDNVDPDGCDEVRQARRAVIKEINAAISNLETKAKEQQQQQQPQQQQQEQQQQQPDPQTTPNPPQDSAPSPAPTPATPTPATTQEEEKKEEKLEKMETDQEAVKTEPAEGSVANAEPQVEKS